MTLKAIGENKVSDGVQVPLAFDANTGVGDDAFVAPGVTVASQTAAAIAGSGNNHWVNVQGTVFGDEFAILLGSDEHNVGQRLVVGENGYVGNLDSSGQENGAVVVNGRDSQVDNAGTIHGVKYGLELAGEVDGFATVVSNSGLIAAAYKAVYRAGLSDNRQMIILHNTGEIRADNFTGPNFSYDGGDGEDAADIVYNSGLMVGDVRLGGANDVYYGPGGRVSSVLGFPGIVSGGAGDDELTGGDFIDFLNGGDDDDEIDGGAGADNLKGENGNDTIHGGTGDDGLYGGAGSDKLWGDAGNDTLDGDPGADTMDGGAGDDTFFVDNAADMVIDLGGGVDLVQSSVTFNLNSPADAKGSVENLTLTGIANIAGTGSALANKITGNAGNNVISGLAGNDSLVGNAGTDTLKGDGGNDGLNGGDGTDRLHGGLGNDSMAGGALADKFVFDTAPNAATNRDTITDFQHDVDDMLLDNAVFAALGGDGALKAAFFYAGKAAHDADDHIVYDKATGALFYDTDGTGAQAQIQFATLSNKPVLTASDFLVV